MSEMPRGYRDWMQAVSIAARVEPPLTTARPHKDVRIFAGPDAEHRAYCGTLTMRAEEAAELVARIEKGERKGLGTR